jgi:hypothetical protein
MPIVSGTSAPTSVNVTVPGLLAGTERDAAPPGPSIADHVSVTGDAAVVGVVAPPDPHPAFAMAMAATAPINQQRVLMYA